VQVQVLRELAQYLHLHPRCADLARASARHFLYAVPMHWMNDWGTPVPLFVREAQGAHLSCPDGHRVNDFCLADTGAMFGHSPPELTQVLIERLGHGLSAMLPGEDAPVAGELLARRFGLPLWQLALSATDANRFCIRWARAATGRRKVLVFDGCYHGSVDDVYVDLQDDGAGGRRTRVRASLLGQVVDVADHALSVDFNDRAGLAAALAGGEVAVVLAEPVMTNVGMVLPDPGFLQFLREQCTATGTLLLIDETHTYSSGPGGYARAMGLHPDLFVVGKAVAGGIPCAVYGFTEELAQRMRKAKDDAPPGHSGIGTTLAGNMLGITALRATLERVATDAAFAHMERQCALLATGLESQIRRHAMPWTVSRVGARCEFQFCAVPPRNGCEARAAMDHELESLIHLYLLNRGQLITPFHNMMLCCPQTTEDGVNAFVAAFGQCLAELA